MGDFFSVPMPSGKKRCQSEPWLKCMSVKALPIEPILGFNLLNRYLWRSLITTITDFSSVAPTSLVVGKPSALALQILQAGRFANTVYDSMDDFPAFYSGISKHSMQKKELAVVNAVDHILVSSTLLLHRAEQMRPKAKIHLCQNACAVDMLPSVEETVKRSRGRVLGYVGTIGKWFDWGIISRLARCPNVTIRLIGPIYAPAPFTLPANVEILPQCSHPQAIAAMQSFDVGLIPFKLTELTESVDPIKYYEYCALGLPVITSNFGEMRVHSRQPGVFTVTPQDPLSFLSSTVEAAFAFKFSLNQITSFRQENSWNARFSLPRIFTSV